MALGVSQALQSVICQAPGYVAHPGLPGGWVELVLGGMVATTAWVLWRPGAGATSPNHGMQLHTLAGLPGIGPWLRRLARQHQVLLALRLMTVAVFLLVIYAGLFGSPLPERNFATVVTWSLWWTGVILSVAFVGSAWCAICPWDALATWLVRRRLWRRAPEHVSLNLRVPRWLRTVWPAWWMFVGLTWLELGLGITTSPHLTAVLALVILVLTVVSQLLFERKAFCRHFCSVGRTIGMYQQLSPLALRPIDPEVCARCTTLECYHGTADIEPCPTHLVMGRLRENTFCTSCGACSQSCPQANVAWSSRPLGSEAMEDARPRWDLAWFVLALVSLTSFHGLTMLPAWEDWARQVAQVIGDSGQLLWTFTLGMAGSMAVPTACFALAAWITWQMHGRRLPFRRLFSVLAIPALPLAFSYHLAHNLNHLVREGRGASAVLLNPLGRGTLPMSEAEMLQRQLHPLLDQDLLFALQAGLLVFGFWLAVRILQSRLREIAGPRPTRSLMLPMLAFVAAMSLFNLWLLMQPMVMRM